MDRVDTARRFYGLISSGDMEGFGAMPADDFVEHEETPGLPTGKEGVLEFFRMYLAAFPDLRMELQDILPSGDKAAIRVRATGTHEGEFMGMPATGRGIDLELIDITLFGDDGLAREHWGVVDV